MFQHTFIFFQAFISLLQAWKIKTRNDIRFLKLPPINNTSRQITDKDIEFVVWCADLMVKFGAKWTGRKCFFRSFIIASILRRNKLPVLINVGLYNFNMSSRVRGHCWLTLNGKQFQEIENIKIKYPIKVGSDQNGICYWIGYN